MTEQFLQEIKEPKQDDPTDDVSKDDLTGWTKTKDKKEEDAELPREK